MPFDRYIAIDWSGARRRLNRGIQVAEFDPGNGAAWLVPSPEGGANGIWCRTEVFNQLQCWIREQRVLIGFDFAFGYPYCKNDSYFPNCGASPTNVRSLWQMVDDFCRKDRDFYGGRFYRDWCPGANAPFRDFYKYPGFEGGNYQRRYRVTDRQAGKAIGVLPNSVFSCYGQRNVGTGSLAGMRFLLGLPQGLNATVWPFEATDAARSTLVEIYPRFFLNRAANVRDNRRTDTPVAELVEHYGATLLGPPDGWTDDERDALVSAAGMAWFANQQETWAAPTHAPACAATHEGWIFGVPWGEKMNDRAR